MAGKDIPANPLLANLVPAGAADAVTFQGYVGPSTNEGSINLYPNITDLSQCVEISRSDIIGFAPLPETTLPLGAIIVWVKKDASVARRDIKTLRDGDTLESGVREVGRLRLKVHGLSHGNDVCQSKCLGRCQSKCLGRCQSRCKSDIA